MYGSSSGDHSRGEVGIGAAQHVYGPASVHLLPCKIHHTGEESITGTAVSSYDTYDNIVVLSWYLHYSYFLQPTTASILFVDVPRIVAIAPNSRVTTGSRTNPSYDCRVMKFAADGRITALCTVLS